eukprot:g28917.t1
MTLEITDSYTTVLRTSVGTNGSTPDTVDATCRVSERPPEQRRASVHHTVVEVQKNTEEVEMLTKLLEEEREKNKALTAQLATKHEEVKIHFRRTDRLVVCSLRNRSVRSTFKGKSKTEAKAKQQISEASTAVQDSLPTSEAAQETVNQATVTAQETVEQAARQAGPSKR